MLDLSIKPKVRGAKYFIQDVNQLYHPTANYRADSQDLVYSQNLINTTKFSPILIKEMFALVKPQGYLIIDYTPNNLLNFRQLEEQFEWLWKQQYLITFHDQIRPSDQSTLTPAKLKKFIEQHQVGDKTNLAPVGPSRFICQKIIPTAIENDSIDHWTFGILTKGSRPEWMIELIASIHDLKIPKYEIIVCGNYVDSPDQSYRYLPFIKRDDIGWIGAKKNYLVKHAKYENICLIHDRFTFDRDWYKGMKKWGNYFEHLGCRQLFGSQRINDWFARHFLIYKDQQIYFGFGSNADYRDWYPTITLFGQLNIFKKSLLTKLGHWWPETLYYGEGEDYLFSQNLADHGFIERINPYSTIHSQTFKEMEITNLKYQPNSLHPKIIYQTPLAFTKLGLYSLVKFLTLLHIYIPFSTMKQVRSNVYDWIIRHTPSKKAFHQEWQRSTLGKST